MKIFIFLMIASSAVFAKKIPATNFKITHNFINKMVQKHNFNKDELLLIFSQIDLKINDKNKKIKAVKPKKPITWDRYKSLFITEKRIENGVKFWKEHQKQLTKAEKKYHIPAEIIVAILGIETNYGSKKGEHPTLETLTQLAFSSNSRKKFYNQELEAFLLMARENTLPPLSILGSYAGAMGYAQFISSSYRYYAIDFNQDGKVDLFSDAIDSIGSIANYFQKHYFQKNQEFIREIILKKNQQKFATTSTNKPKKTAKYWKSKGVNISHDINNNTKISFIKLKNDITNKTWLSFLEFFCLNSL